MIKKFLIAAAIVFAAPAFVFAQDVFVVFDQGAGATSTLTTTTATGSSSVFIYSEFGFDFDAADLNLTVNDSSVVEFTGGVAFNPTFNSIFGGTRFDAAGFDIQSTTSSSLFLVNVVQNGVDSALIRAGADPGFDANVGVNGAVLLARLDFNIVGEGIVDFDLALGLQGVLEFPAFILNPTFGSATLTVVPEPAQVVTVRGTHGPDEILVEQVGDQIAVEVNGVVTGVYDQQDVTLIEIFGFRGHDKIEVDAAVRTFISGGFGKDEIVGGRLENEIQGGPGEDIIFGGPLADNINSGRGWDVVYAFGGDDVIFGGTGPDMLFGGAGDDDVMGGLGADALAGGPGNDEIIGNAGADTLYGGGGDDCLIGHGGPDDLFGGPGADRLFGGFGFDDLHGSLGIDTAIDQGETEFSIED